MSTNTPRNCVRALQILALAILLASNFNTCGYGAVARGSSWVSAYNKAMVLYQKEKYSDAQASAILAYHTANTPLDIAMAARLLAHIYNEIGKHDDAIKVIKRSISIYEAYDKRNSAGLLDGYFLLTLALRNKNNNQAALDAGRRAVLYAPTGSNESALANFQVGIILINLEKFGEAQPFMEKSYQLTRKVAPSDQVRLSLVENDLALIYLETGRYAESERLYLKCLDTRERLDPKSAPATLASLGELYRQKGDPAKAETYAKRAIDEGLKAGESATLIARKKSNLSVLYVDQRRFGEAEALLIDAMKSVEDGSNAEIYAYVLGNLGGLYFAEGRSEEAADLDRKSMEVSIKSYGLEATSTAIHEVNVADDLIRAGKFADAEPLLERADAVYSNPKAKNRRGLATVLEAKAIIAKKTSDYAKEVSHTKDALKLKEEQYGPNSFEVANAQVAFAIALVDAGQQLEEARDLVSSAIETASVSKDPRGPASRVGWTGTLARVYLNMGDMKRALTVVEDCVSKGCAEVDPGLDVFSRGAELGLISQEEAFAKSVALIRNGDKSVTALTVAKARSRYAESSGELEGLIRKVQDADGLIKAAASRFGRDILTPNTQESLAGRRTLGGELETLQTAKTTVERLIAEKYPKYAALASLTPFDADAMRSSIRSDEAFVALWATESNVFVLAATPTAFRVMKLRVTKEELDREVIALRASLEPGEGRVFDEPDAKLLFQQIFGPIDDIVGGRKQWTFFANGPITSLPLQALVVAGSAGERRPTYLVEKHVVTVLPTIDGLQSLFPVAGTSPKKTMIGFGNPVFKRAASSVTARKPVVGEGGRVADWTVLSASLPSLPDTEAEERDVAATLGGGQADLFFGEQASVTKVKAADLANYRILYFATHGLLAGDVSKYAKIDAEPALVLSIPSQPTISDDGLLKASDISLLRLNADLVVLSACNTAAGDHTGAQALSGLAQSFFYAGARSVIVSHWPVVSDSTAKLMANLFRLRADNPTMSAAEALQRSSLAILNDPKHEEWRSPVFWAPFVVVATGDYR